MIANEAHKKLYEAMRWTLDQDSIRNKYKRDKLASLCEWWEKKEFFTEGQADFATQLLQQGD